VCAVSAQKNNASGYINEEAEKSGRYGKRVKEVAAWS
jgi:hypothetical protein